MYRSPSSVNIFASGQKHSKILFQKKTYKKINGAPRTVRTKQQSKKYDLLLAQIAIWMSYQVVDSWLTNGRLSTNIPNFKWTYLRAQKELDDNRGL